MKSNRYSAFDTAIYYLSVKDRTIKEVSNKLKEKGYGEVEIKDSIDKLIYYGYLNDKNYALSFIKSNLNKKGKRVIKSDLQNKGIDKETIAQCIDYIDEEIGIDEYNTILDIYERRFSNSDLSDEKTKRRIVSYFVRRGFCFDDINKLLSRFT